MKDDFLREIKNSIKNMYVENPVKCIDFPKIINENILKRDKPLAFYIFTTDKNSEKEFLKEIPFGGVGTRRMGKYHGQESFEVFSNYKSVIKKVLWFDNPVRYHPFAPFEQKFLQRFL